MVGRSIIHSIYFAKPLTQPDPWGTDSELSLNYKALKDQTISIHTVHPNLREGFTIITVWGFAQAHCKYSHTCYRWAGMYTFVSCYQDRQQSYAYIVKGYLNSSISTIINGASTTHTPTKHNYGFQPQQQQRRPQHHSAQRFNYGVTQKHKGARKNTNQNID